VELDDKAIAYLNEIGVDTDKSLRTARKVDIVCAFHLIEHLEEPRRMLEDMAAGLKEDGRVLLAVPNGGESEVVGAGWVGFRLDLEHLNYFSARTLSMLLNKCSLYLEKFWLYKQPAVSRDSLPPTRKVLAQLTSKFLERLFRCPETLAACERGTYTLTVLARKVSPAQE